MFLKIWKVIKKIANIKNIFIYILFILSHGCNGGWGSGSMEYVIENGISYEKDYPYVSGTDATVPACNDSVEKVFFI